VLLRGHRPRVDQWRRAMIEFVPAPDHVFAVRLVGTLTPEDVDRSISEIEIKLQKHERLGVFADLTDFHDFTGEALIKDFKYSFGKFREWKRFPREAVVTDKQWIRMIMGLLDPLIPQIEIKSFAPDERERALAWTSDIKAEADPA
jgi:hypothetical protein